MINELNELVIIILIIYSLFIFEWDITQTVITLLVQMIVVITTDIAHNLIPPTIILHTIHNAIIIMILQILQPQQILTSQGLLVES